MSDKPIHADIVRADQIRVGEKYAILTTGKAPLVSLDDSVPLWTCGDKNEPGWIPGQIVTRILPDPVEVRDFWRATCNQVTTYGSEIQVRAWTDAQKFQRVTIEHVRETILSREEVQP